MPFDPHSIPIKATIFLENPPPPTLFGPVALNVNGPFRGTPGVPRHQHLGHLEETPATGLVRGTAAATEGLGTEKHRMEGLSQYMGNMVPLIISIYNLPEGIYYG